MPPRYSTEGRSARSPAATTRGDGARQTAMAAQDTVGAPETPPPPARRVRTELGRKLEEENRRRRLAGLRRLGTRTLLGADRFGTDTLGA